MYCCNGLFAECSVCVQELLDLIQAEKMVGLLEKQLAYILILCLASSLIRSKYRKHETSSGLAIRNNRYAYITIIASVYRNRKIIILYYIGFQLAVIVSSRI